MRIETHAIALGLADALCDHFRVTLLVARIATILALISFAGEEELLTKGAHDRLVELSVHELMSVHLEHVSLPLSHSSLTTDTIVRSTSARDSVLD